MKIENKTFAARVVVFGLFLSSMISSPAFGATQSYEFGRDWYQLSRTEPAPSTDFSNGIATSDSGAIIYSLHTGNKVFKRSRNYGQSWEDVATPLNFYASSQRISTSGNGAVVAIADAGGFIWISQDYGDNWVKKTNVISSTYPGFGDEGLGFWGRIWVSTTGSTIFVAESGDTYISTNYGGTFTKRTYGGGSNRDSAMSDDGRVMIIASYDQKIYISTNYGSTFSQVTSLGSATWSAVGVSGDGNYFLAAVQGSDIWISSNTGSSWNQMAQTVSDKTWKRATISKTGSQIVVTRTNSTGFLTSDNFGATFKERTPDTGQGSRTDVTSSSDGSIIYLATSKDGIYASKPTLLTTDSNYGTVTLQLDTCLSDTSTSTSVMAASVILLTDTASAIANSETSTYVYFSETDTALWGANYNYGSTQDAETCGYRDMNGTVTLTRGRFMASSNSAVLSETTTNQTDFIQYIGNTETASVYSGLPCGNMNASPRNTSNVTTSCTTAIQANYQQLTYLNSIQVRDSSVKTGVLGQPSGKIYTHVKVKKSAIAGAANGTTWVAVETFTVTSS